MTRRQFLKASAAGIIAAPLVVPSRLLGLGGAEPPSERIRTGHVGLGGRGRENLRQLEAHAVALCDVDASHLAEARKVLPGEREVFTAGDYRKLLDRKDVDAVVISTPDHWHALPAIHACQAGKHVYCEKPLTLAIVEGRKTPPYRRAAQKRHASLNCARSASRARARRDLTVPTAMPRENPISS